MLAVGAILTRALIICPSYLPGDRRPRRHLALGERDQAERRAAEELELARTFGTAGAGVANAPPASLPAASAGVLLREAIDDLQRGDAT